MADPGGGGRRNLTGVLNFLLQWEGLSEAHGQLNKLSEAIKGMKDSSGSTQAVLDTVGEAARSAFSGAHEAFLPILESSVAQEALILSLGGAYDRLIGDQLQLTDLTGDQQNQFLKAYEQIQQAVKKLQSIQNIRELTDAEKAQLEVLTQKQDMMGDVIDRNEQYAESWDKLTKVIDYAKVKVDWFIGALTGGGGLTGDSLEGLNILKESFGGLADFITGLPDNWLVKLLGGSGMLKKGADEIFGLFRGGLEGGTGEGIILEDIINPGGTKSAAETATEAAAKCPEPCPPNCPKPCPPEGKKNLIDMVKGVKKASGEMKNLGKSSGKDMVNGLGKGTKGIKGLQGGLQKLSPRFAQLATRIGPALGKLAALGPVGLVVIAAIAVIIIAIGALIVAFKFLKKGMQTYIKDMEAFRTANFRASGSIRELTNSTYEMSKFLKAKQLCKL